MRTAIIVACGSLLWGLCVAIARWFGGGGAMGYATLVFVLLWLAAAAFNVWLGVNQADCSFGEELPLFLLTLGVPAALAIFVKIKCLSASRY